MDDNLDHILSTDQNVVPSSAFVENMMAAVRREASTPVPISFPWWRVVPGLAICGLALTAFLVIAAIRFYDGAVVGPVPRVFVNVVEPPNPLAFRMDCARPRCLAYPDPPRTHKKLTLSSHAQGGSHRFCHPAVGETSPLHSLTHGIAVAALKKHSGR